MSSPTPKPSQGAPSFAGRLLVPLFLLVHLALVYAMAWQEHVHSGALNDFATYVAAARVYAQGLDPYDLESLLVGSPIGPEFPLFPFVYPPPFLALLSWVPGVEPASAYAIWFGLNEALTLAGVLLFARACGPRIPGWAWALALAASAAVPNQLAAGQSGGLLLAFLGAACWAAAHNRLATTGLILGLSLALKPMLFPSLILLAIAKRSLRPILFAALTYALVHAAFLAVHLAPGGLDPGHAAALIETFHTRVLPSLPGGQFLRPTLPLDFFGNQSIGSLLVHHAEGQVERPSHAWIALVPAALLALASIPKRQPGPLFVAAALAPLLVAAFLFEHHLLFAVPALALAATTLVSSSSIPLPLQFLARPVAFVALAMAAIDIERLRHLWTEARPPWKTALYDGKTWMLFGLLLLVITHALLAPGPTDPEESA